MQLSPPAVFVLIGPGAAGKTTARGRIVAAGFDPAHVLSLDDTRVALRARSEDAGRPVKPLQDYTVVALKICAERQVALIAAGVGYLADNTHLRRQERTDHLRAAHDAGL